MLRNFAIALCALLISPAGWAVCDPAGQPPTPLYIPAKIIRIAADAPIDSALPIAEYDSTIAGGDIWYKACPKGTLYGKRVNGLDSLDAGNKIFKTNIPGIGVKPLYTNGTGRWGSFPSDSYVIFEPDEPLGDFYISGASMYRLQFFKMGELRLSDATAGDIVMNPGMIVYNFMMNPTPASFSVNLNIGEIKIISTPACTVDGAKRIDFNRVTPTLLSAGVARPLDFSINCVTDYGGYAAKAAITTMTPSADASYIQAEDADGNRDRLAIYITDGANRPMKVNGTTYEQKSSINSRSPAGFNWQATLKPGSTPSPGGGTFTAKAEIIFDIQ